MAKVSVIIPVYGVEKYIERCARSVFEQTLEDIEIIFVDDCTPDNSISIINNILSEYPLRKDQTKIIRHEKNGGLPIARHTGLMSSNGDYVYHCDSDDWLDVRTCEEMYNTAQREMADIVVCDIERTDGEHTQSIIHAVCTTDKKKYIKDLLYMRSTWSVVNKLVKRDVYLGVMEFPKFGIAEDMALCLQLVYNCKKIAYVQEPFYKYYSNQLSMTYDLSEEKCMRKLIQCKANAEIVIRFFERNCNDKDILAGLDYVKWSTRNMIIGLVKQKKYYKVWKDTFPGLSKSFLTNKEIRMAEKIKFLLISIRLFPIKSKGI